MVLHDLNLAANFADRAVILSAGRIMAEGPVDEAFQPTLLTSIYATPLVVERSRRGVRVVPDWGRDSHPLCASDRAASDAT